VFLPTTDLGAIAEVLLRGWTDPAGISAGCFHDGVWSPVVDPATTPPTPQQLYASLRSLRIMLAAEPARADDAIAGGVCQRVVDAGLVPRLVGLMQASAPPFLQHAGRRHPAPARAADGTLAAADAGALAAAAASALAAATAAGGAIFAEDAASVVWGDVNSNPETVEFEAQWCVVNVCAGDTAQCRAAVDAGAIRVFVEVVGGAGGGDVKIIENAIWGLGNIAGDVDMRDRVRASGAWGALLAMLGPPHSGTAPVQLLRQAAWALSNCCRGRPTPPWDVVSSAPAVLAALLQQSRDAAVLADACWSLSYLSDGTDQNIEGVLGAGVVPRLVELLAHDDDGGGVRWPALRTLGNLVTGSEHTTQAVLDGGLLAGAAAGGPFGVLLRAQDNPRYEDRLCKNAVWALSNVTAGSRSQIEEVRESGLMPAVLALLDSGPADIKKEACWTVSNWAEGGSHEQIRWLVGQDCLPPLVGMLRAPAGGDGDRGHGLVGTALDALGAILRVGRQDWEDGDTPERNEVASLLCLTDAQFCLAEIVRASGYEEEEDDQEDGGQARRLRSADWVNEEEGDQARRLLEEHFGEGVEPPPSLNVPAAEAVEGAPGAGAGEGGAGVVAAAAPATPTAPADGELTSAARGLTISSGGDGNSSSSSSSSSDDDEEEDMTSR